MIYCYLPSISVSIGQLICILLVSGLALQPCQLSIKNCFYNAQFSTFPKSALSVSFPALFQSGNFASEQILQAGLCPPPLFQVCVGRRTAH